MEINHIFILAGGLTDIAKNNSWVIFPQCSENDRWPSLKSDTWNETFDNKITTPNKSLGLVIKLMDEFIEKFTSFLRYVPYIREEKEKTQ